VLVEEIQLYTVGAGGVQTNVNLCDLVGSTRADLRFGQRPDGEIYVMTKTDGYVRRLVGDGGLPGDYNGDDVVNAADYTEWRDSLGQNVALGTGADGNRSGTVDQIDYDVWKLNFGRTAGSGATALNAVPEPATVGLLATVLLIAFDPSAFGVPPRRTS
jgi:hypothetical protein